VSAVRFVLAHGESLDSIASEIGLEGAAFFGHWQLCEFLENGADFHVRADRGSTFDHGMGWGAMEIDLMGRPLA
jgi:hypothetical protein